MTPERERQLQELDGDGRGRLEELDVDRCLALLEAHRFGRLAVDDGAGPLIFPVNYLFEAGTLVVRTAVGTKLEAAVAPDRAAFEIDGVDHQRQLGWSVVVRGRLEEVTDAADVARLEDAAPVPYPAGGRRRFIRLLPSRISGRRIAFPDRIPASWQEAVDLGNVWYDRDGSDLLG